jgi:tetratricopeptide (TPR) repeat protein/predicted Ser/Thr protein kinase
MQRDFKPVGEADSFPYADRVAEVVEAALERNPAERRQFVDEACRNDADLRREIESLLGFQEKARNFIETPAYEVASKILVEGDGELKSGQILGDYKVLSLLGEGGMGEVYLVEDTKLERRVAIKVVKHGAGSASALRHWYKEEKILGGLNHPNIARLYGVGMTPSGLPYFVMEYVDGHRLDHYCQEEHLSIQDRLSLFRKICSAVTYAHQNLIIHRDIKPANIRVTSGGEPKLLDFGIAKLLDPESSSVGEMTMTLAAMMTPEYASPEQVRGEPMTTASDIYSLGVILYELLAGQRPYRIKTRSPAEIARAITEQEPARPSTAIARGNGSSKSQIPNPKMLRGDLDNIVLKAMRKEPQHRYASVGQFSEDVLRHLQGRTVIAHKDTMGYRTRKFVARHKAGVSAATLIVLSLVAGVVATFWQTTLARHQANIATRERDHAQHERLKAERINTFLQRMLSFSNQSITSAWPVAEKRDVTINEMLDQITPKVEAELSDQPDVRAQVERTIGGAYASQGRYDLAERNLRAALNAETQLYGEESLEAADTMSELGVLCYRQLRYDESSSLLEKAVAAYRKQRQANAPGYNAAKFALALKYLGVIKAYQIDPYAGKPLLAEALQVSLSANLKGDERGVLAFNKTDAGANMVYTGEVEKGEALLREALAEYRQISNRPRWEQGSTLTHLGAAAMIKRQFDEAQKFLQEGEQIFREILGDKSSYLVANLSRQAAVLLEKNDLNAAEAKAREALKMARDCSPEQSLWWEAPVAALGKILIKSGRAREGEDYLRQALAILEEQTTKNYFDIGNLKIDLSQFLLAENRLAEAEQMAIGAREDVLRNLGPQHPLMKSVTRNLMTIYEKEGKRDLAEALK